MLFNSLFKYDMGIYIKIKYINIAKYRPVSFCFFTFYKYEDIKVLPGSFRKQNI